MLLKSGFLVLCYLVPPFGMASQLYLMANGQSLAGCSSISQEVFVRPFLEPSPQTFFSSQRGLLDPRISVPSCPLSVSRIEIRNRRHLRELKAYNKEFTLIMGTNAGI